MDDSQLLNKSESKSKIIPPIAVGLFVALILNFILNIYLGWNSDNLDDQSNLIIGLVIQWIIVGILFILIFFWEKKSWDSIGIRKISKTDVFWGFVVLIIGYMSYLITDPLVRSLNLVSQSSEISGFIIIPLGLRIFMVLTAGITEEIIFRGYLIERTNYLTRNLILSAGISYFIFVVYHFPFWGVAGLIQIGVWAIPITVLYVRTRNLTTCILVHILTDAVILVPMLMGQ